MDETLAQRDAGRESASPFHALRSRPTQRAGLLLRGRYEIRAFLAQGATAKVYLARDHVADAPVALKVLSSRVASDPAWRRRFEYEGRTALRVVDDLVVRVLDVHVPPEGTCFLVMEPLIGESLGEILRRGTNWTAPVRLQVARWAARAVEAVHRHQVVHRDIKPDNFLALGTESVPTGLKLLDFGMASDATAPLLHAEDDHVLGTAEYMAPEQILAETSDVRSDVYSFGVLLFRLFTEHLPFEVERHMDALRHQLFSPAPPPSWLNEDLDPRIEAVILTALMKHPENRYASMTELAADLDLIAHGSSPLTRVATQRPDVYVATTPRGETALRLFARPFGRYAKPAASDVHALTELAEG